jgi:hypothetical protein
MIVLIVPSYQKEDEITRQGCYINNHKAPEDLIKLYIIHLYMNKSKLC